MVSIHRPLGYGPSTLPLRHSASCVVGVMNGIISVYTATPNITRQPGNSVEVIESSRLVLEVKAECRPGQPVYQWFKERDPIVEQNKPTLVIDKIQKANSGTLSMPL